jgi:hypothetical protein
MKMVGMMFCFLIVYAKYDIMEHKYCKAILVPQRQSHEDIKGVWW